MKSLFAEFFIFVDKLTKRKEERLMGHGRGKIEIDSNCDGEDQNLEVKDGTLFF